MREIPADRVTREIAKLCVEANYELPGDVIEVPERFF